MRLEILNQAFLAHVLNNSLWGVIGALILVVLEQVLENMSEHFGINTDFMIFGIVFINGEVVLTEEFEQVSE